ncbi:Hypp6429 [Branchiostoma lanceolatum]|uniref:Hypp6429 protein n=1 Tax=Branchiostoma lanceolatum TaxID=7740 RepID=A0A8J9YUA4_BRALA|nr:Hypp6429 [Branchiostoma lanceolatum]
MAVRCALVLLLVCVVPQLVVEGCWPSKPAGLVLVPSCLGARAELSWCRVVLVPSCPGAELSWCRVVLVPSCPGAELSWCRVVLVPSCPGAELSWCRVVLVPSCPGAELSWCRVVLVPSCPGAELSWCRIVLVPSCPGAELSWCRVVLIPIFFSPGLMTRCEKERADGPADGVLPMNSFVKQCEADGSYSTVQCGGSRRFCYCAHPETGVIYKETKTRGQPRSCDNYYILREDTRTPCEKQMYSLNPAMLPGGFIKECEADGSFRKAQRDSAGLWYCVNSETGELYGQTGMRSQIDCDEYEARNDAPAVHVARATPCEKQKFSLDPAMLPGGFIKECEADGSFRKEQRDSSGLWYCVNSETGELYGQTGMRSQIDCVEYEAAVHAETDQDELTPCEKQRNSDNPAMLPGGFIKECEADGSFRKEQRDSAGLWYCVNSETGELYGQTGMRSQIDCVEYEAAVHAEADQDELTPCEKQMDSDNPTMLPGGFIKECEADGSFARTQCDSEGLCYCVNTETGVPYPPDERTPCEKQRDSDNPTMLPGGFIKECEADGSFSKLQCDSEGLCYCVNTETGELYGQTGMRGVFDCEEYQAMHDAGENWFRGR